MNPEAFRESPAGRVIRSVKGGYWAFVPNPPPPRPTATPMPQVQSPLLPGRQFAKLEDFWNRNAERVLAVPDTSLPLGESDTVYRGGDEFWSHLNVSYQSARRGRSVW